MTAPDDDQDFVTIRIPRRAAAMYAAELDVLSSSELARTNVYAQIGAGAVALVAGLAIIMATSINLRNADAPSSAMFLVMGVFLALIGSVFVWLGARLRRSMRERGLI